MLFELHCHTIISHDGFTSIEGLVEECCRKGIGVVAVTEHDEFRIDSRQMDYALGRGVYIIPAMEVTTDKGVHIIGFFLEKKVPSGNMTEVLSGIRNQGGLISIPHPFKPGSGLMGNPASTEEEISTALEAADFIEKYNGGFDLTSFGARIENLAKSYGLRLLAASDSHKQWQVGRFLTEMDLGPIHGMVDLKEAMRGGSTRLLKAPDFRFSLRPPSAFQKLRNSDLYQKLIAKVPYAWKRRIRLRRYARDMRNYNPTLVKYEVIP